MKRLKEKKGITLIALIITIIVMLILVAVTVNVAINGGLFGEANKAASDTERETIYERLISLAKWDDKGYIDLEGTAQNIVDEFGDEANLNPAIGEINNASTTEITVTIKGKYVYTITKESITKLGEATSSGGGNNPGPVVSKWTETTKPGGWTNEGVKAYTDGKGHTIPLPNGYSISEVAEEREVDTGLVIKDGNGNEFVWIPVTSDFTTTYTSGWYSEPTSLSAHSSQEASCGFSTDDYAPMVTSINKYRGFYVGRYETTTSSGAIGSKKGEKVLNNQSWFNLYSAQENANVTGNGSTVQPTMIWGQQWDAMCSFIGNDANSYIDLNTQRYVTTAGTSTYTSLGNKADILKNIYDLRGNVFAWTAEAGDVNGRAYRGGNYYSSYSVSYRNYVGDPSYSHSYYRFSSCTLYKIA